MRPEPPGINNLFSGMRREFLMANQVQTSLLRQLIGTQRDELPHYVLSQASIYCNLPTGSQVPLKNMSLQPEDCTRNLKSP
jgi:hypothetical protein